MIDALLHEDEDEDEDPQALQVYDPVLDLPVFLCGSRQWIFGLPALQPHSLYMIHIPNEPHWRDETHLLECTWGVDYL